MTGTLSARIATCLLRLFEGIMPRENRTWARAMRAEADHIDVAADRLSFVAGCLRAAVAERLRSELLKRAVVTVAGCLAGVALFAHAASDGSQAWPLLWPFIGGGLAALATSGPKSCLSGREGALLGLRAGAVAAILFAVGAMLVIWWTGDAGVAARLPIVALGAVSAILLSSIGGGAVAVAYRVRRHDS